MGTPDLTNLSPTSAAILGLAGLLIGLVGYRYHVLCAYIESCALGALLGIAAGNLLQNTVAQVGGAILGGVLGFALAKFYLRLNVAALGGIAGCALGGAAAIGAGMAPWIPMVLVGAASAVLGFIYFRSTIIILTAGMGGVMAGVSGAAALHHFNLIDMKTSHFPAVVLSALLWLACALFQFRVTQEIPQSDKGPARPSRA